MWIKIWRHCHLQCSLLLSHIKQISYYQIKIDWWKKIETMKTPGRAVSLCSILLHHDSMFQYLYSALLSYSEWSGEGYHSHLWEWCWPQWSRWALLSVQPCLWLQSPLGSVLSAHGPYHQDPKLSGWHLDKNIQALFSVMLFIFFVALIVIKKLDWNFGTVFFCVFLLLCCAIKGTFANLINSCLSQSPTWRLMSLSFLCIQCRHTEDLWYL